MLSRAFTAIAALVIVAAGCPNPGQVSPGSAWVRSSGFGVQVEAPKDVTVQEEPTTTYVSSPTFQLNLFLVDKYSPSSAAEQQAIVQNEPGFVKFTNVQLGATTWRLDYDLDDGTAGTVARIAPGRALDCGIHHVTPASAAATAAACQAVKPL
jgi:hypothetical protein